MPRQRNSGGFWPRFPGDAAIRTYRWALSQKDFAPEIQLDLATGTAIEETYQFTGVKRLQEPEHDGLLYFLKSSTDQAYIMFDSESQDLGARGDDAMHSSFAPCAQLRVVRAPVSRLVLSNAFTGQPFDLPAPSELVIPPDEWPEQDEYCEVPWDAIESRYGRRAEKS
jgi:hypothetical protein